MIINATGDAGFLSHPSKCASVLSMYGAMACVDRFTRRHIEVVSNDGRYVRFKCFFVALIKYEYNQLQHSFFTSEVFSVIQCVGVTCHYNGGFWKYGIGLSGVWKFKQPFLRKVD